MKDKFLSIILRYSLLFLIALPNLYIIYSLFTPLTIYPVSFLLDIFFEISLNENMIHIKEYGVIINLIPACIAGSAYYLLLILNLSVPDIKLKKRATMITYSLLSLLLINILRIFILSLLIPSTFFEVTHELSWNLFSTLFVVIIWFSEVKMFKIDKIPIYSDIKTLYNKIKQK